MPKMFMNIGAPSRVRYTPPASFNQQVNVGVGPSVRMNLLTPMINRVSSAKGSCGACGK